MTILDGPRVRIVEVVEVIRVVHLTGMGTEEYPAREVEEYYGKDGKLISSDYPELKKKKAVMEGTV